MESPSNHATTKLPVWRQRVHNLGISLEAHQGVLWIAYGRDHESVDIRLNHNNIAEWFTNNHADQFPTIAKHVWGKLPLNASTEHPVGGKKYIVHGFMLPPTGNVLRDAFEQRRIAKFRLEAAELAALLEAAVSELSNEFTAELKAYAKRYYQQQERQSNG